MTYTNGSQVDYLNKENMLNYYILFAPFGECA